MPEEIYFAVLKFLFLERIAVCETEEDMHKVRYYFNHLPWWKRLMFMWY